MNIKKIGLTALAGSLVATSAFAGALSVSGGASFEVQHVNGGAANAGKAWSMGNSVTFTGSGELDNGLNVSVSFELDQGAGAGVDSANDTGKPFDNHSVSIGNDTFGTLTFAGHGGSSAVNAVEDTASTGVWDNGFSATNPPNSSASNNMLSYTNSNLYDGLSVTVSHVPHTTGEYASATDWAIAYTGVEGLTLGFASGEDNATKGSQADVTVYYGSYAYGPITVAYSQSEYDSESQATAADLDYTAYSISYTLTDELFISYGVSDQSTPNKSADSDQEISGFKASYTTGGMTLSGKMVNADNVGFSTATTADQSMWEIAASFAF